MKILRNFVLVLMVALGIGLCFNPTEKVSAASGVGTVKNIKKSKVKYADGEKINGNICYGYYRRISWKKVKGVKGYVVYRYDDLLNEWNKILTTKTNSFIISSLLQDETFTIKICAYKKSSVGKVYGDYSKDFKYKEYERLSLRSRKKVLLKGCYAEGKDSYFEYASKQAFLIQNRYRTEKGVAPLVWSKELYNVAKIRSKELTKLYSHKRPDGSMYYDAFTSYFGKIRCKNFKSKYAEYLKEINSPYVACAEDCYTENAGKGIFGVSRIMNAWRNSKGHYYNLLDAGLVSGAISCYRDENDTEYWISSFAYIDVDNVK